jgi:hypothetical protein
MKKVKMIVSIAGEDFSYKPGDEALLETKTAEAWIAAGHSVAVTEPPAKKSEKAPKE